MSTLTQANREWANRPADERYLSLDSMLRDAERFARNSKSIPASTRKLQWIADESDPMNGLKLAGSNGRAVKPSNWGFRQAASLVSAQPSYLSRLPACLAADALNYHYHVENPAIESLVYLGTNDAGESETLRAMTGPKYGRIHNAEILSTLVSKFGDGLSGDFRIPGEFGKAVPITKDTTTLYMSDRDMFVFLADEEHRIELPNRRAGRSGSLARGFFVQNSEVGSSSLRVTFFLFDYMCSNHLVWGATDIEEIAIRHTVTAPDRWLAEAMPTIKAYSNAAASPIEAKLIAAQQAKLDDSAKWLANRFGPKKAKSFAEVHMIEEARPIESLWDAATAITAYAKGIEYMDDRVELEREAGKILDLVAA